MTTDRIPNKVKHILYSESYLICYKRKSLAHMINKHKTDRDEYEFDIGL